MMKTSNVLHRGHRSLRCHHVLFADFHPLLRAEAVLVGVRLALEKIKAFRALLNLDFGALFLLLDDKPSQGWVEQGEEDLDVWIMGDEEYRCFFTFHQLDTGTSYFPSAISGTPTINDWTAKRARKSHDDKGSVTESL